jgi:hypothetical protein
MWAVYEHNEDDEEFTYHVVPLDDDEMHTLSKKCECRPIAKAIDEISTTVIHNSYDGREGYEQAIQVLNSEED